MSSSPRTPATAITRAERGAEIETTAKPEPAPALAPADRYVLEREMAQGGMGRIYTGRDRRLGRPVAVKVLLDKDPALARRFEREAQVAARLQHPGIVTVYDAGFWPTGEPYLVMKHVLGQSLEKVIAEAETFADRLALLPHVIAVVDALAYAHDQGIIHRDLKPGNVIVGAFGETVVIDWGLAKDLRAADAADPDLIPSAPRPPAGTGLTEAGSVLGTPPYMPPEQAAGEAVDARADVYALGAMLYHVLAGAPPPPDSQRSRAPAADPRDYQAPVPLARVEPHAPPDLVAIVAQAMAADRGARYLSAFELGEDLKRFQTGQLVAARRYSVVGRFSRWVGRHPAVTVGALAVAAVLAGRQCVL